MSIGGGQGGKKIHQKVLRWVPMNRGKIIEKSDHLQLHTCSVMTNPTVFSEDLSLPLFHGLQLLGEKERSTVF